MSIDPFAAGITLCFAGAATVAGAIFLLNAKMVSLKILSIPVFVTGILSFGVGVSYIIGVWG